ncbi:META domain-containing protein [Pontiellaceae bacterium B12219]|nr:META domain-containing protein [Pontiellaceae bacterium B12219]
MILKMFFRLVGMGFAALFLAGCQSNSFVSGTVKNVYVGPAMVDGTGAGPMTCLMVKDTPEGKYTPFYSPIAGFDYVPGFDYFLEVKVTERDPVPADASKFEYTLMNVVFKAPAGLAIDSTAWKLAGYESVSGTMEPPVHNSIVNLRIAEGHVSGNAGANRFFGDCSLNGSKLKIKTIGSSMMMGTPELMAQEKQFLKLLGESVDYQIVGTELRLRNADGRVVLKFNPLVEPTLTSNGWKAILINNGKGGVSSVLQESEITIEFKDQGRVSGSSGCNSFSGGYESEGNAISFSPLAGTRRMCSEPEGVMEQESLFLQALEVACTYSIYENKLELRDAQGALQVSLIKQD